MMSSEPVLRCTECNMAFKSRTLLAKHRSKFCVGGVIGDPRQLARMRTAEEEKRPKQQVEERPQSDGYLSSQKVQELQELKNRRSKLRASRYLEEKMLLGDLENLERQRASQIQPSRELRELQTEYAVLMEKENKLKKDIAQLEVGLNYSPVNQRAPSFQFSSYALQDSPRNHWWDSHQRQVRLLAEDHGKQLADIKARNTDLERQKEDIRRRLEELGRKNNIRPQKPEVDMTQKLISELKAQEDKNQKTLQELKRQLSELHKTGTRGPANKFQPVNIPYYGNSLLAEIGAMRQAYLQSGGNDPTVLAQMADMQADAQALEEQHSRSRETSKPKSKPKRDNDSLTEQLLAFDLENQRLQRELLLLQQQNLASQRRKRHSDDEDELDRELKRLQKEHLRKMTQLQQEMELYKHQALLDRMKKEIQPPTSGKPPSPRRQPTSPRTYQPQPLYPKYEIPPAKGFQTHPSYEEAEVPALLQKRHNIGPINGTMVDSDPLLPAPYDPQAGFVVFYDFVLGLEPSLKTCRLIVGLYSNTTEMEPSVLPTVYCEPPQGSSSYMQGVNVAMLGAKQPVPNCRPSLDLSIVVEMQVSGGAGSHMDSRKLVSRAWTKVDLFDDSMRVQSGRWKIPFRVLPVRQHVQTSELNTIPQFGVAELYLRIANARDADNQTMVNVTSQNSYLYRYPPQGFTEPWGK